MPLVKICGITTVEDARHAVASGADLLGFIQYPPSPRYLSAEAVAVIASELPRSVRTVGVFVNEPADAILKAVGIAGFDVVQLHGDEDPAILAGLGGVDVIKAMPLAVAEDLDKAEEWPGVPLLVDTPCPEYGGSGVVGNWALAARLAAGRMVFLAGGLNPENVADAVRVVAPYGVDVSTGVELRKGVKDPVKVAAFIANAKRAEVSL